MEQFQVAVYPLKDKKFLTSFTNPLTKRKIRGTFESREAVQSYCASIEQKFGRRTADNYRDLTIEELIVIFTNEVPGNPFTRIKRHIIDFTETFGEYKVDEITADALKVWLDQIQRENKLKEISMRGLKCQIDTLFKFLEDREVISESPLRAIMYKNVVRPLKMRNILTPQQIEELLQAAKNYAPGYLYPLVKLIAETGAKVSEVIELRGRDLDLDRGKVNFPRRDKTQERTLTISPDLVDIFRKRKLSPTSLVFTTYYKEPFTRNKASRLVIEFKAAKLYHGEWTLFDLRHSYAVNFLNAGGDMNELQRIMGHVSIFDTRRLYGDASAAVASREVTNPFE